MGTLLSIVSSSELFQLSNELYFFTNNKYYETLVVGGGGAAGTEY